MKIVRFKGGLGNQLFQYTFLKNLESCQPSSNVYADFTDYTLIDKDSIRVPRIKELKIRINEAEKSLIKKVVIFERNTNPIRLKSKIKIGIEGVFNKKYYFEKNRAYSNLKKIKKYTYFDGYWQSWKYVFPMEKELRKEITPRNSLSETTQSVINIIKNESSVFVGIRCGDYLTNKKMVKHYGGFQKDYYLKAMGYMCKQLKDPTFYIFTNDLDFVKKELDLSCFNVKYREDEDQTNDLEELFVMGACKHAIISNSTFNWWGAWLIENKDKIVIAPKKWFHDNKPIDIVPPEWIRM